MIIQGIRYASDFEAKKLMIETGQNLDEKGYTLAQDGSMSVRVGPNAVWVTKGGSEKGALSQGDFVRVDLNGKSMNHSPDAVLPEDLEVHLKIYRENPQIQGVIHAYPVCAVVLQENGRGLEACDYTPAVRELGRITLVPSGDKAQITAAAALAAKSDKGVILEKDGCLMWGSSIREAYRNIRVMDYCTKALSLTGGCSCAAPGAGQGNKTDIVQGTSAGPADPLTAGTDAGPASGIPGLTGLYHPAGHSEPVSGVYSPADTIPATAAVRTAGSQPEAVSGIQGLTGLYHPAGNPGAMLKQARAPQQGFRTTPVTMPLSGSIQTEEDRTIQTAPSDPVRDATMAEVVRKSMKMLGKGGL